MKPDPIVTVDGATWRVLTTGATRPSRDGAPIDPHAGASLLPHPSPLVYVYCHLASTTRFRETRGGPVPVQMGAWIPLPELEDARKRVDDFADPNRPLPPPVPATPPGAKEPTPTVAFHLGLLVGLARSAADLLDGCPDDETAHATADALRACSSSLLQALAGPFEVDLVGDLVRADRALDAANAAVREALRERGGWAPNPLPHHHPAVIEERACWQRRAVALAAFEDWQL